MQVAYVLWWGSAVGCWRQDEATQSVAPTLNVMPSHSQAGACIKLVSGPWLCVGLCMSWRSRHGMRPRRRKEAVEPR